MKHDARCSKTQGLFLGNPRELVTNADINKSIQMAVTKQEMRETKDSTDGTQSAWAHIHKGLNISRGGK